MGRNPLLLSVFAREQSDGQGPNIRGRDGSSRCYSVELAALPTSTWGECLEGTIGGVGVATTKTLADIGIFSGDAVVIQNSCAMKGIRLEVPLVKSAVSSRSWSPTGKGLASEGLASREAADPAWQDGVIYVRQAVFDALGGRTQASCRPIKECCETAQEVKISRVARSDSSATADYSPLIGSFLQETSRMLSVGDIFAVWSPHPEWFMSDTQQKPDWSVSDYLVDSPTRDKDRKGCIDRVTAGLGQESRPDGQCLVYFRIMCLNPEPKYGCALISSQDTAVSLQSAVNSRVPALPLAFVPQSLPLQQVVSMHDLVSAMFHESMQRVNLRMNLLLHGRQGCGKRDVARAVCDMLGVDLIEANVSTIALASGKQASAALDSLVNECVACAPGILLLRKLSFVSNLESTPGAGPPAKSLWLWELERRLSLALKKSHNQKIVIVGSVEDADELAIPLRACFTHEIALPLPDDSAREAIIRNLTKECILSSNFNIKRLVLGSKGCTGEEIVSAIARAGQLAVQRMPTASSIPTLEEEEVKSAIDQRQSSAVGALKIPNVSWKDVGGLEQVKKDILDTVQLPLQHPELFSSGMKRRSGVLLFGPPGTGKTLLAKAVATECSLSFLSVKGPELINMYIGESERNVRQVFKRAAEAAPCVIFFDELDSLAPNRGNGADSGGVMDRVVSQLLAEMDGTSGRTDVFVMGATNRPDLIDPALLRPGRFDKLLYCGLGGSSQANSQSQSQADIMAALTRKMLLAPDVNLALIAESLPPTYTGADLYALCADAWQRAAIREVSRLTEAEERGEACEVTGGGGIMLCGNDFWAAKDSVVPSVTPEMLERYEGLRLKFS